MFVRKERSGLSNLGLRRCSCVRNELDLEPLACHANMIKASYALFDCIDVEDNYNDYRQNYLRCITGEILASNSFGRKKSG